MNTPGTTTENWQWRLKWQQIELQHDRGRMQKMRMRNEKAGRLIEPES
jgi:4-alpha-glucanotransferase